MSLPCRCTACGKRKSITRRALVRCSAVSEWRYKCPRCGGRRWYIDNYRLKNELGVKPSCDCAAYHFRHRKGSGYCHYHPDAEARDIERRA